MLNFQKNRERKRVFIFGLDGVPYSLLKRFTEEGLMPNLSSIIKEGTFLPMETTLPEVSSTSWVTFMTGVNPGKHGIYGFMDLKKESYDIYFPNSYDIKRRTIWDIAGEYGKRSIVLNVPATNPAKPLNGILTAGFVALDLKKATYPEEAYEYLSKIDYKMDVDAEKASENLDAFKKDVDKALAKREEAFRFFLKNEEWDIFIATITETDRLHHFFFNAIDDKNNPMHNYLLNFYEKIDKLAGDFYKIVKDENTSFMIVSDHGFASIKKEVYLNSYLREKGYLSFKIEGPQSLNDISPKTQAFALDPSRIYINLENKYPLGSVPKSEYESIRDDIKKELLELNFDNAKVIKNVFYKEELYKGTFVERAPDIIVLSNEGFDLKGTIKKKEIFGRSVFTGCHTRENATLFINEKIRMNDINIIDIAPTVLSFIGLAGDAELMDGRVLLTS